MIKFYIDITHKSQQRDKKTLEQAVNSIIAKDKLELYGWQMVDVDDIDEICKEFTEEKNDE
jgi:hypothetical protein